MKQRELKGATSLQLGAQHINGDHTSTTFHTHCRNRYIAGRIMDKALLDIQLRKV